MRKRFLTLLLSLAVVLSMLAIPVSAAASESSGSCGAQRSRGISVAWRSRKPAGGL